MNGGPVSIPVEAERLGSGWGEAGPQPGNLPSAEAVTVSDEKFPLRGESFPGRGRDS